ncbi:hypothetical protein [Xanthocytophaga agilis]|uniref:Uncharacterized protein n=1 Tax=Xanthocytophaga agilis TaxID=3048010 RepID=A0AAE3R215_9BACT|nr:hypothetical protein [Xanthocytophaga agilis]MDJ1500005.1 hypothetical protein [Xanthocytophaga agilis]
MIIAPQYFIIQNNMTSGSLKPGFPYTPAAQNLGVEELEKSIRPVYCILTLSALKNFVLDFLVFFCAIHIFTKTREAENKIPIKSGLTNRNIV